MRVWDTTSGKLVGELASQHQLIRSLKFSPDGKILVSADPNAEARPCLWDVVRQKEMATVEHPGASIAVFSPDGKRMATCDDYRIRIWDTATWKELRSMETIAATAWRRSLAFSPDGKKLVTAGNTHAIELWDAETGRAILPLSGHRVSVESLQFSPDGKSLASADAYRTVLLWDVAGKKELHRLQLEKKTGAGHRSAGGPGYSLAFSPDARTVATYLGGIDKNKPASTIRFWDTATGENIFDLPTPDDSHGISFSPDGRVLGIECGRLGFRFWSLDSRKLVREISDREHAPTGHAVFFAPDGRTFATLRRKELILYFPRLSNSQAARSSRRFAKT